MSGSNRGRFFAPWIALFCLFLSVIAALSWAGLEQYLPKPQNNDYETSEHADRADDRIDRICVGLTGIPLAQCEDQIEESAREDHRAEKDLNAQRYMAIWAFLMTVITFFTLVVTALGVHFIRQTLNQTADTNRAAADAAKAANETNAIMRAEQRPWVTLEREASCEFNDVDSIVGVLSWNYNLVNKGKTPAYSIAVHTKLLKSNDFAIGYWGIEEFADECIAKHQQPVAAILFPGQSTNFSRFAGINSQTYKIGPDENGNIRKLPVEGDKFGVFVCITYQLALAETSEVGLEARGFGIERDAGAFGPWQSKMLEFSRNRLVR